MSCVSYIMTIHHHHHHHHSTLEKPTLEELEYIYIYTHTHIHTYIYVRSEFLTFYNTFNSSPFRVQNQKRKKKKEKNWPFITHWIDRSLNRQIKIIDVFFQNAQTYYLTTIFLFLKYQHISHIYLNTIKLAINVHI